MDQPQLNCCARLRSRRSATLPSALCGDLKARLSQQQLRADLEAYLDGFALNVQNILENFGLRNPIPRLSKADALGTVIEKVLSPGRADRHAPLRPGDQRRNLCHPQGRRATPGRRRCRRQHVGSPEHSTLANDAFLSREFAFVFSNPPNGMSWKTDLARMVGKDGTDQRFLIEHGGDAAYSLVTVGVAERPTGSTPNA